MRILCVDDERHILRTLERFCRNEELEMRAALSPAEGLRLLQQEQFEVVISDFRMPGKNGLDFLREVRRFSPRTARILLSGYAEVPAVAQAVQDGEIFAFLRKPWRRDELLGLILAACSRGAVER